MIYSAPAGTSFAPVVGSVAEREMTPAAYVSVPASDNPPPRDFGVNFKAERSEFQPVKVPAIEQFDWQNPTTNRDYIRLEQKVLAGKSTADEASRYQAMKRDRNSVIFADRYITDYAEIQRVEILSIKIAELQKYLRPIKIG
jgi:hypothetical protein